MKKLLLKTAAVFVSICIILSANIYSSDLHSVGALRDDLLDAEAYGYCIIPEETKVIPDGRYVDYDFDVLVLNEGLESVGKEAFVNDFYFFTSVYIPASVKTIGYNAFGYRSSGYKNEFTVYGYGGTEAERYANANGFRFVTVNYDDSSGENILTIDDSITPSFTYNKTFDKVIVNPGASVYSDVFMFSVVKNIILNEDDSGRKISLYGGAFADTEIESIYVPKNVQFETDHYSGWGSTFSGCKNLKTAYVASNISRNMFSNCTSLKEVYFTPDNIATEVDDRAFADCKALEKVDFSRNKKAYMSIGYFAFQSCENLRELILEEGMTCYASLRDAKKLETYLFYGAPEVSFSLNDSDYSPTATVYLSRRFSDYKTEYFDYFVGEVAPIYTISKIVYTPSNSSINDYKFYVDGRADKIQVIEESGATRTFKRNASNVSIVSYKDYRTVVDDMSRELTYEVWTVRTRLTPDSNLQVHSKYGREWSTYNYKFSVSTLMSDQTLKSAKISANSENPNLADCQIITGSGVSKIRIEYEDGMTSTIKNTAAELNEKMMTYTYNLTLKTRHSGKNEFKVYIKTPSKGWKYETTLTYNVK